MNDAMDSPSTPSISVQQTSQHKAKAPNLLKPLKQAKPPSKVRSWEMESLTKSSSYYQQLISRFRSFILSVGNISSHFSKSSFPSNDIQLPVNCVLSSLRIDSLFLVQQARLIFLQPSVSI